MYSFTDVQMRAVDCHLPMTNVYRERLEKGLEVLYWGLEGRLRRFLDVYMTDKEKPRLRGFVFITAPKTHQLLTSYQD